MTVQHPKLVRVICNKCLAVVNTTDLDVSNDCKDWRTYKVYTTSQSFHIEHRCPNCPRTHHTNDQAYKGIRTLADLVPTFRG